MSPLRLQLDRIRRRGWLVLAIAVLAILAALAASRGEQATYTGKSTLTITSQDRAPEQDAVLAQGYAEYFNEGSYQQILRARAGVPADVTLNARTAAASPIVFVEAVASNPDVAASAATRMAETFRDDVNANLRADRDQAVEELRKEIAGARAELDSVSDDSAESTLITSTILALQDRMAAIQSDNSNQLQELQLDAGVSSSSPNLVQNVALGLVGGLILGCLAALAFAAVENRLATADDVRDQLGLDTLAVIPDGKSRSAARSRVQQLMRLANLVSLSDLPRPMTVAVAAPRATTSTSHVAEGVAAYRAVQGERTLLVKADLHDEHRDRRPGVAEFLAGPSGVGLDGMVLRGRVGSMQVLPAGNPPADPYALFSHDRFADLVERAKSIVDLVVIESPPINEAAEGQVVCTTADGVILVIEENATRTADAAETCQLLEQVSATLLGVVITGSGLGAASPPPPTSTSQQIVNAGGAHQAESYAMSTRVGRSTADPRAPAAPWDGS